MLDWFTQAGRASAQTPGSGICIVRGPESRLADRPAGTVIGDGEKARHPSSVVTDALGAAWVEVFKGLEHGLNGHPDQSFRRGEPAKRGVRELGRTPLGN